MRKAALNLCLTTAAISINISALPQTSATARGICQIKYLEYDIVSWSILVFSTLSTNYFKRKYLKEK